MANENGKAGQIALLMAMMEPKPEMEGEFNDWYDTEHTPHRAALPGFLSARRLICLDGWPKYLAVYDLDSLDALKTPSYLETTYAGFSNWGKRLLTQVSGQFRGEAVQIHPGAAEFGAGGAASRVVFWRLAPPDRSCEDAILSGFAALYGDNTQVAQYRVFRSDYERLTYICLVEARVPISMTGIDPSLFGPAASCIEAVNEYAPYSRPAKAHGIQR